MEDRLQDGRAVTEPHPEERPLGRVSKDGHFGASWFETREDALLTMRVMITPSEKNYAAAAAVTTCANSASRFDCER
jgi:hypothetical protein